MKIKIVLILNLLVSVFCYGETADNQVQSEIERLKTSIQSLTQKLEQTTDAKQKLKLSQNLLTMRNSLMRYYESALVDQEKKLNSLKEVQTQLTSSLSQSKSQYADILRISYIMRMHKNPMLYLLGAGNLQEFFRKSFYINKLERYQRAKYVQLRHLNTLISENMHDANFASSQMTNIKEHLHNSEHLMDADFQSLEAYMANPSNDGIQHKALLSQLKTEQRDLERAIFALIENTKNSTEKSNPIVTDKPGESKLLRYPMKSAFINAMFGTIKSKQKGIVLNKNNGIDLQSADPFVYSCGSAVVLQIQELPGNMFLVLTRDDDYFYVYSNMESVLVRVGEQVAMNASIGKAKYEDQIKAHQLHFEVWKNKTPINPIQVLK